MAAPVLPDVDDQALARRLDAQVTVDLGPAGRLHVGDVQITEAAVGEGADVGPAVGDPGVVAQRLLVVEGDDHGVARVAAPGRGDGQLHRLAGRTHQQRAGAGHRVDGLSVDGEDRVARADRDPGGGERRVGVRVGGLRGQHPLDAPDALLVPGEVGAEQALPHPGPTQVPCGVT